jgi:hypothetical protein
MSLLLQRCFHHLDREAAARCLSCQRFYCRECVTEHEGRMICANCVSRLHMPSSKQGSGNVLWTAGSTVGLLFAWLIFYYLGMGLARIPSTFHVRLLP